MSSVTASHFYAEGAGVRQRTPEQTRIAAQTSLVDTLRTDVGSTPGTARVPEMTGNSDEEEDVQDPMVSNPIKPFLIPVALNPRTSRKSDQGALIDSGCTRCLLRCSIAEELGLRMVKMRKSIVFEQMDGSTLGGCTSYSCDRASYSHDGGALGAYSVCGDNPHD